MDGYYETKYRKYYLSPVSKQNFGHMHYYEAYGYDFLGHLKLEKDPGGTFTLYDYVYPEYTDRPVRLGDSGLQAYYTNKYNKFDLPFKISKVISYKTGDDINMTPEELLYNNNCTFDDLGPEIQLVTRDTYYKYNDENRNLTAIVQKKWDSIDGTTPQWLVTRFSYDDKTNNLIKIKDPRGNETRLVYDTEYETYIIKDIRQIKEDNNNRIVNKFTYDDTGRMKSLRSFMEDTNGNFVQDYTSASALSCYSYDNLNRVVEAKKVTENNELLSLTSYIYDDEVNTFTKYGLLEKHENGYLAIKTIQRYDSLDRKKAEETYRLNIKLNKTSKGEYQIEEIPATEKLTSKKEFRYHAVFTDKVLKTALYEDEENMIFLRETSYDPHGRVTKIRAGYCDTMNNINTRLPAITEYIYMDAISSITELCYRDGSTYTKKRTANDWNGKVKKVMEWIDLNPEDTGSTYLDSEPGDPGVVITEYTYDSTGDCVFMKNGEGETYYHDYNTLGQLEKTTCYRGEADAETAEYSY